MGDQWILCRPIAEGTELRRRRWLHEVDSDASGAAGAATVLTVRTAFEAGDVTYALHDRVRRYEASVPQDSGDDRAPARYTSKGWSSKSSGSTEVYGGTA